MRRRVTEDEVENALSSEGANKANERPNANRDAASGASSERAESGLSETAGTVEALGGGDPSSGRGGDPDTDLLLKEIESLKDRHLRLAAEFDNYRKRAQHQLGESSARAQAYLASEILDVLDDFGRVTEVDPESASVESVIEGVGLVRRKMRQVLDGVGLEEIDPTGERFDPNTMEAVVRVPASSADEDETVAQVFQRGYRFRGQLLRPARVSVRKSE